MYFVKKYYEVFSLNTLLQIFVSDIIQCCYYYYVLRKCVLSQSDIGTLMLALIFICFRYVKKISVILSFPLFLQYTCGCFLICNAVLQFTIMVRIHVVYCGWCSYVMWSFQTEYNWCLKIFKKIVDTYRHIISFLYVFMKHSLKTSINNIPIISQLNLF